MSVRASITLDQSVLSSFQKTALTPGPTRPLSRLNAVTCPRHPIRYHLLITVGLRISRFRSGWVITGRIPVHQFKKKCSAPCGMFGWVTMSSVFPDHRGGHLSCSSCLKGLLTEMDISPRQESPRAVSFAFPVREKAPDFQGPP